jgi:hypothetical protein
VQRVLGAWFCFALCLFPWPIAGTPLQWLKAEKYAEFVFVDVDVVESVCSTTPLLIATVLLGIIIWRAQ